MLVREWRERALGLERGNKTCSGDLVILMLTVWAVRPQSDDDHHARHFSSPLLSSGTVSPHHPITLRLQPELDTDRVRVTQNQTDWQTILLLLVITKTFL